MMDSSDRMGDLLRRFYAAYGMPNEGPPTGLDVTQIIGKGMLLQDQYLLLTGALHDQEQMRQFIKCRELLGGVAPRLENNELRQELSNLQTNSNNEFHDQMLSGLRWLTLANCLDYRREEMATTLFDEEFQIPHSQKEWLILEGSLVFRLYLSLVYIREGAWNDIIANGARSGKPCCMKVAKLLNSDYVRRIRNALSHSSFFSCIAGIAFRDDSGVIVATPRFLNWLCLCLLLIQSQVLSAVPHNIEQT